MKRIIFIFSLILVINIWGQIPDTIKITTKCIKGLGPFGGPISTVSIIPLDSASTFIKGIPDSLSKLIIGVEHADYLQWFYQNYYAGNISKEYYNSFKRQWNWNPASPEYTRKIIKVDIPIAAGYDKSGNLLLFVDKNNNYDLSDDKYYKIPPLKPGKYKQRFRKINVANLISIKYEFWNGENNKSDSTWLYVDINPFASSNKAPQLQYAFAQYHLGKFNWNGNNYFLALRSNFVTFHGHYYTKVWQKGDLFDSPSSPPNENELIKLGSFYYKVAKISIDGKHVILIKDIESTEKGGNQVGIKTLNFTAKSITGNLINLDSMRGNYILLDFWGTWCMPCRYEIPKLKSIYKKYRKKNFILIGIANDNLKNIDSFIKKNKLDWPQILQDKDKSIINLYGVEAYPTTFLINPKGEIILKSSEPLSLIKKLEDIFNK